MERILRTFENHADAEQAASDDDDHLTISQRFEVFMQLMAPYYAASTGFQRIYRVDDFHRRTVRDDWRLCLQPVPKPKSDR
ncbi:hypothetical protein Fuma_05608 [Fuerstiella marisgermanici]|uniref:Uncharacterized protein n=1 Tax=Fuerstiella marisgermanici TaxID=1891926 RepID=A0A1P8WPI0_9PLAN|nr:hypothetical protein Fuma_05608 [Fuerstiella marisgermanici]